MCDTNLYILGKFANTYSLKHCKVHELYYRLAMESFVKYVLLENNVLSSSACFISKHSQAFPLSNNMCKKQEHSQALPLSSMCKKQEHSQASPL